MNAASASNIVLSKAIKLTYGELLELEVLPAAVELLELLPRLLLLLDCELLDIVLSLDDDCDELDSVLSLEELLELAELELCELELLELLELELLSAAIPPISRHDAEPAECDCRTYSVLDVLSYQSAPLRNGRPRPAVSAESLLAFGFVVL
jgi:hypothetical protein